ANQCTDQAVVERLSTAVGDGYYKANNATWSKEMALEVLVDWVIQNPSSMEGLELNAQGKPLLPGSGATMESIGLATMRRFRALLRYLASLKHSVPFHCPVDTTFYADYYDYVDEPMDLRTLDRQLHSGVYGMSVAKATTDARLIWRNAKQYNKEGDDVWRAAEHLSQVFETLKEQWIQIPWQNVKGTRGKRSTSDSFAEVNGGLTEECVSVLLDRVPWSPGCSLCGLDGDPSRVLVCDGCDKEFHLACLEPPLTVVPEGDWFCPGCQADMASGAKPELKASNADVERVKKQLDDVVSELIPTEPVLASEVNLPLVCQAIHRRLADKQEYALFVDPVDTSVYDDYLQRVKHPMDIRQLDTRLLSGWYGGREDFDHEAWYADAKLLWKNCQRYNAKESAVWSSAETLKKELHNYFRNWIQALLMGRPCPVTLEEMEAIVAEPPEWSEHCEICEEPCGTRDFMSCSKCGFEFHLRCLSPPLDASERPDSMGWLCPRCKALQQPPAIPKEQQQEQQQRQKPNYLPDATRVSKANPFNVRPCKLCRDAKQGGVHCRVTRRHHIDPDFDAVGSGRWQAPEGFMEWLMSGGEEGLHNRLEAAPARQPDGRGSTAENGDEGDEGGEEEGRDDDGAWSPEEREPERQVRGNFTGRQRKMTAKAAEAAADAYEERAVPLATRQSSRIRSSGRTTRGGKSKYVYDSGSGSDAEEFQGSQSDDEDASMVMEATVSREKRRGAPAAEEVAERFAKKAKKDSAWLSEEASFDEDEPPSMDEGEAPAAAEGSDGSDRPASADEGGGRGHEAAGESKASVVEAKAGSPGGPAEAAGDEKGAAADPRANGVSETSKAPDAAEAEAEAAVEAAVTGGDEEEHAMVDDQVEAAKKEEDMAAPAAAADTAASEPAVPVKRKRGRPRKHPLPEGAAPPVKKQAKKPVKPAQKAPAAGDKATAKAKRKAKRVLAEEEQRRSSRVSKPPEQYQPQPNAKQLGSP
ncbi:unnamed protein product, partial [Chrysoparadoxa australica]